MEERLIEYPVAYLAKQVGFNPNDGEGVETRWFYSGESIEAGEPFLFDRLDYRYNNVRSTSFNYDVLVSTQSLLQKYLREVHNIIIEPIYNSTHKNFDLIIHDINTNLSFHSKGYSTYEEALERGLYRALKSIPKKTD